MFDKVYTCELVIIGSGELKQAGLICSFTIFTGTMLALRSMRKTLDDNGLQDHKMINIRRLK